MGNLCVFLDVKMSPDRGMALCTQMTQETQQPQRKRQRTNSNVDGHKDNYRKFKPRVNLH